MIIKYKAFYRITDSSMFNLMIRLEQCRCLDNIMVLQK